MPYKPTGRPTGRPRSSTMRPVTIKLPEELLLDAQVEADLSQTTLSTLVRDGLARRLEETALARATKRRERARKALALRPPLAPVQMGGDCTLYCGDALQLVPHLPRQAAVVSDPPYPNHYDYTKTRRRDARWTENFPGMDQPFDPTPWLQFPEVILMGADHYWVPQMERGAVWFWHKMPGQDPGDQSPCEIIWLSTPGPPAVIPHKWRGGMREGEENWVHLHDKLHPAQKPIAVMTYLVQHTAAPVVIGVCSGYV